MAFVKLPAEGRDRRISILVFLSRAIFLVLATFLIGLAFGPDPFVKSVLLHFPADKLLHGVGMFAATLLAAASLPRLGLFRIAMLAIMISGAVEIAQGLGSREADIVDFAWNVGGVLVGLGATGLVSARWSDERSAS